MNNQRLSKHSRSDWWSGILIPPFIPVTAQVMLLSRRSKPSWANSCSHSTVAYSSISKSYFYLIDARGSSHPPYRYGYGRLSINSMKTIIIVNSTLNICIFHILLVPSHPLRHFYIMRKPNIDSKCWASFLKMGALLENSPS